jgi:hypothetical protein
MRALAIVLSLPCLFATSALAQDRPKDSRCSEIAHRIACHAVSDCSKREPELVFEKRVNLEGMIHHLCVNGPNTFDEYWWIDVTGAYQPYYADRKGGKLKFPPTTTPKK